MKTRLGQIRRSIAAHLRDRRKIASYSVGILLVLGLSFAPALLTNRVAALPSLQVQDPLTLDKTIFSGDPYGAAGGTIVYHYDVRNTGDVPLADPVTITDDQSSNETCPSTTTVGNNDGFLDPGESLTCTASHIVTLADLDAGSLTNHATAHAGQVNSNADQATAYAARDLNPELSITKTADVPYLDFGGSLTFTIRIDHTANSRAPAKDVVISDLLPPELNLMSGPVCNLGSQVPDVECKYDNATRTISARWSTFTLAGGSGQISFAVRANQSLRCGEDLDNVAVVTWSKDPQGPSQTRESRATVHGSRDGEDCPRHLPRSGFIPDASAQLRDLPAVNYNADLGMSLDIPRLGLDRMAVVGVPLVDGTWDVDWLGDSAGWLETGAAPGESGNSVITAHVTDIYGRDGPFAQLDTLAVGDNIVLHASDQAYTYQVQSMRGVAPDDLSSVEDGGAWQLPVLTLVTCSMPNYTTHTYDARLVVQAVLVQVNSEQ